MGQIVSDKAKPKRCNLNQLSQVPTPAAGEHILVSSDNSENATGQGNFDCYIVGDGTTAATALPLISIADYVSGRISPNTFEQKAVKAVDLLGGLFESLNLFNPNDSCVVPNAYVTYSSGKINSHNSYNLSGWIPVEAGEYYIGAAGATQACFYDANKNYISGVSALSNAGGTQAPANAAYMRVSVLKTHEATMMIVKGTGVPSYQPFGLILKDVYKTRPNWEDISGVQVSPSQTSFFLNVKSTNLINPAELETGHFIKSNNGDVGTSESYDATGWIPVEGGAYYSAYYCGQTAFYDENKIYISGVSSIHNSSFQAPANAAYMRTSKWAANADARVNKGTTVLPYEEYYNYWVLDEQYIPALQELEDKTDELSESMTIVGEPMETARVLDNYVLNSTDSGSTAFKATNGYKVIMWHVGANTKFRVHGSIDISETRVALLGATGGSSIAPWKILLPAGDAGEYTFDGVSDTREYVAISVKNDTAYFCSKLELVTDEVKSISENTRTRVDILTTDTQVEILTKMLNAYDEGNCDVHFQTGTYTFDDVYIYMRDTLGWTWTMELPIGSGNRYYFHGSTLISNAPSSTYETSRMVLGCKAGVNGKPDFELHDGIIINNGGTYCVHDECLRTTNAYRHAYYNMRMYYNTGAATENISKCIGGGAGTKGLIIIKDCVFQNDYTGATDSISWHGLDSTPNTDMAFFVENCYLNKRLRISGAFKSGDKIFVKYFGNANGVAPYITDEITDVESYVFNNTIVSE